MVGGFCPDEWFGVFVPSFGPVADVDLEGLNVFVDAALEELAGEVGEPTFNLVDPGRPGRREVDLESRVSGGDFLVDFDQKILELHGPVPPVDRGDLGPVGDA